jgi:6-pyruvoyltetrahydropterin/6-carboxytetrahydropterin synthase
VVYITRKLEFCASHRYYIDDLSKEENFGLFGKCSYEHGHGHNYTLEVTVKGVADPKTGMVINLTDLDQILKTKVADVLDHKYINFDVPYFREKVPTTENLVIFIWDAISESFQDCSLHKVRLIEDPYLYAEYCGE